VKTIFSCPRELGPLVAAALVSLGCGPSDLEGMVDGPAATDSTWSEVDAPIEDSARADADEAADAATSDAAPCVPVSSGEVCNGLDDDCDGTADEGFPGLGTECDVGLGACERTGIVVCTADGSGVVCNATPGVPGPAELCGTGIDENCNGAVDEGYSLGASCDGPDSDLCNEGVLVCTADRLGTRCSGMTGNSAEACNGLDDDCDGSVDEGLGLGTPCDGTDGDLCNEGVLACNGSGGMRSCS